MNIVKLNELVESQFHYGSIQMNKGMVRGWINSRRSQFHYGSIQIRDIYPNYPLIVKVSIPLWFDSNTIHTSFYQMYSLVSIPLWFDSNS